MKTSRPRMHKITDEMRAWSAALQSEVTAWPRVSTRPMFGLHAVYRGKKIFAALPRTRTMDRVNSIAFKLPLTEASARKRAQAEPGLHLPGAMAKAGWITLEIHADGDLRRALKWLERAYSACR